MASAPALGVIDRGLADKNAELAGRAVLMKDLDARLVLIDAANDIDRFHVLQGLEDPELPDGPERYYCFQRWGNTGGRGDSTLEGPMLAPKVEATIRRTFEEKTGYVWGTVEAGHPAFAGMYWLQASAKPEAEARWEYYVSDGVDGKRPGWYAYEAEALREMEDLYAQHVANDCAERTATRTVKSGHFSYTVDLSAMNQTNTKTRTQRDIRRRFGTEEAQEDDARPGRPAVKAPTKAMKAMKAARAMKATPPAPERTGSSTSSKKVVDKEKSKRPPSSAALVKTKAMKAMKTTAVAKKKLSMKKPSMKKPAKAVAMKKLPMKKATKKTVAMKKVATKKPTKKAVTMKKVAMKKVTKKSKHRGPISKTATGKMAFYFVLSGRKTKTVGGLKKEDLVKNKWGKIVPKRKMACQKKNTWMLATKKAQEALGLTGFCPCGGKTAQGKALYKKAKELHEAMK